MKAIHRHSTHARNAGLDRLRRANRFLIAGSIALTGVLADVAANAFPGKSLKSQGTSDSAKRARSQSSSSGASTVPLAPPEHAPQASAESERPAGESSPSQESSSSAPQESSSSKASPEAPRESAPAQEASAPVVSGGS